MNSRASITPSSGLGRAWPEQVHVEPATAGSRSVAWPNRLDGVIEALLFIGERYEARIGLPWGQSILVYLPPGMGWKENQAVTLTLPRDQVRVWGT